MGETARYLGRLLADARQAPTKALAG